MTSGSFEIIENMAADLAREHDGESVQDAVLDAGVDSAQGAALSHIGRQGLGPLLEIATSTCSLIGGAVLKKVLKDINEARQLRKKKQERLKNMSPAELRRLKAIERRGIAPTQLDGIGDNWVDMKALSEYRIERRRKQNLATRRVIRAAAVSIAGKGLRGAARNLTAGSLGVLATVATATTGLAAIGIGIAVAVGAATVVHKGLHFVTNSKDDFLSPLFDYAVTRALYGKDMARDPVTGETSAMRQMKQRYAKIGRGVATVFDRLAGNKVATPEVADIAMAPLVQMDAAAPSVDAAEQQTPARRTHRAQRRGAYAGLPQGQQKRQDAPKRRQAAAFGMASAPA